MTMHNVVYGLVPEPERDAQWRAMINAKGTSAEALAIASFSNTLYSTFGAPWTEENIPAAHQGAAFDARKNVVEQALARTVDPAPAPTFWVPSGAQHIIYAAVMDGIRLWTPHYSVVIGRDAYDIHCTVMVQGQVSVVP